MNLFLNMFLQCSPRGMSNIDFDTKLVPSWEILKPTKFCADTFKNEDLSQHAFLFVNKDRDHLRLLYVEEGFSQILEKKLIQGSFITPLETEKSDWVKFNREALSSMLKIEKKVIGSKMKEE